MRHSCCEDILKAFKKLAKLVNIYNTNSRTNDDSEHDKDKFLHQQFYRYLYTTFFTNKF